MTNTSAPKPKSDTPLRFLVRAWGLVATALVVAFVIANSVNIGRSLGDVAASLFLPEPLAATASPAEVVEDLQCREAFEDKLRGLMNFETRLSPCATRFDRWARELPDTSFSITGSALVLEGSAQSLVGAALRRDSMVLGNTRFETVVIDLPRRGYLTLRFQSKARADEALKALAGAMGKAGA